MTHYQVCFTRISGKGSGDGWQAINATPGLPQEAISAFTRFQNGNITPPSFDAEDVGSQLVTELQNDGNFAFYTLIKCNAAADDRGRPIMFAHSYVFPLNEFVQAPQDVLGLEQSNFAFEIAQTASAPQVLTKKIPFSLSEAVESLGLNKDSYAALVQCVYFILDSKAKNSLHIICDCAPDTIRKFMTCIYAALPFEFRKKITYATYELQSGAVKTIIFDRKIKSASNYHLIPQTGENNVISDVVLKRWKKYEFMRFVPNNYKDNANLDDYFKCLEEKLDLFGSAQTTSLDLYKIAYDLISDEQNENMTATPEVLCKRLNELLSAPISHPYIDQQIQYVLGYIVEYKVVLNDVLSEKLCKKLETTRDQDLIECGYLYNSEKISRMTVDEGAKYLFAAYSNRQSESFIQIRNLLDRDSKGREILNQLYTGLIAEQTANDKEHILAFFEETKTLFDRSKIQVSLFKMVCAYLKLLVEKNKDPFMLMSNTNDLLCAVLSDRPEATSKAKAYVKKEYWREFNYADLEIDSQKKYKDVVLQDDRTCQLVFEILCAYQYFTAGDVRQLSEQVNYLFPKKNELFTAEERSLLVKKLLDTCVENRNAIDDTQLDIWLTLAFLLCQEKKNPARFLIENRIRPISKCFERAYPRSEFLKDEQTKERFVEYLTEYVQEKTEYSKVAAEALQVIKEHEKHAKQDIKRQQRKEKREMRESSEKSSLFSGIGGVFKRKNRDDDDDKKNRRR
ncbi:hypothetical protein Hs30E_10560 [Lactococcus hodotermopsidis]|uniref:Uncharacterized protein n=1 Tax=Pseudolactococcus hodotermopsidis TaxID=2709157 RepID=A0A6A0BCY0_9LACT|nr:hypothetical protein [Lactococcus hodotermopsidis]GFH42505.1 hypothetical protein Hs30E_10560 [Lactococcus hodotermopsidis]